MIAGALLLGFVDSGGIARITIDANLYGNTMTGFGRATTRTTGGEGGRSRRVATALQSEPSIIRRSLLTRPSRIVIRKGLFSLSLSLSGFEIVFLSLYVFIQLRPMDVSDSVTNLTRVKLSFSHREISVFPSLRYYMLRVTCVSRLHVHGWFLETLFALHTHTHIIVLV